MSNPINVLWCFGNRGDRCHGMLQHAFAGLLWPTGMRFEHHLDHKTDLKGAGAIVVVSGGVQRDYVDEIAEALKRLPWALVIISADEEGQFEWRKLKGPNRKFWIQMPAGERHTGADFYFPIGWPGETREILRRIMPECPPPTRKYPWSFCGQMQHSIRKDCVDVLGKRMNGRFPDGGRLSVTAGFHRGYEKEEFLRFLTDSYLAPNPAGTDTADCFRIYESLEAGCLPVVNRRCNKQAEDFDYWKCLLGTSRPSFPVVGNWGEVNPILDNISKSPALRQNWMNEAAAWWLSYKQRLSTNIESFLLQLTAADAGELPIGFCRIELDYKAMNPAQRLLMTRELLWHTRGTKTGDTIFSVKRPPPKASDTEKLDHEEFVRQLIWHCNWHPDWFGSRPILEKT